MHCGFEVEDLVRETNNFRRSEIGNTSRDLDLVRWALWQQKWQRKSTQAPGSWRLDAGGGMTERKNHDAVANLILRLDRAGVSSFLRPEVRP
jgi:hypothetical protein